MPAVEVSAKTKTGIEDLLKLILLISEMEDLKGEQAGKGEGTIIESYLDAKRGPTCTLILEKGILNIGDIVATRSALGKIKKIEDFQGKDLKKAQISMPVVVLGFKDVPGIGEKVRTYSDISEALLSIEKSAQKIAESKEEVEKEEIEEGEEKKEEEPDKKVLNILLKTDFLGSVDPIKQVLDIMPKDKVLLNIFKTGVGDINFSDIKLAGSTKALLLGFRVKCDSKMFDLAKKQGVRMLSFDLIYDLVEGMRKAMTRQLTPEKVKVDLGQLKILVIFKTEGKRQVVGGKVLKGEFSKGAQLEILRKGEIKGKGRIIGLQRNKRDIKKARERDEVGILYEGSIKVEEGDVLQMFTQEHRAAEL